VTPDIDLGGEDPTSSGPAGDEAGAGAGDEGEDARLLSLFDLRLQEVAYLAVLATREALVHPALLDFLR